MKIYISHSTSYDFENELYCPLKSSELCKGNEVYFPHDKEPVNTKNMIGSFDLIIAEVSFPSTGQGIEIGWADFCNKPILCIYKQGSKISSSLRLITKNFIEYSDLKDMTKQIENFVNKNSCKGLSLTDK